MFDLDSSHLTNLVKRNGFVRFVSRFDKIDDVKQRFNNLVTVIGDVRSADLLKATRWL